MRVRAAVLIALAATVVAPAQAGTPLLPQANPAGSGRLTFLGFPVYDAQLWVAPGFRRSDVTGQPLALELHYLRGFKAADVARRSLQEMQRAGTLEAATARQWEDDLRRLLPDMQAGDRITGVHRPGTGAEFFVNGRRLGLLADPEFSRRFFAIWLGPSTSEPALRDALLAGTEP